MYSTKFSVSIHILSLIALNEGEALTSDYIARSINTNPAFVRRLMSLLKKAGLIYTQTKVGTTGLAKPCDRISMKDIFKAVEREGPIFPTHEDPNEDCPIGARIGKVVEHVNNQVKSKFEEELDSIYLVDILNGLEDPK
ncbi:Rrf2 family transcriptional regulator [Fusibacter ferrireducens]|uniref:Rrf2 family transcriptional regulator n=1 Tax=Fusibacter ferrireducens TaxID=2785058 RepID=A0ABR9ZV98_9FIRM|nr:Rrf2 family transcriptional regulator [Fusibacter ferrireducens]MBF4693529.1 Rrf2 family transcriptional regulator [Fusibacter ferrireducens]